MLAEFECIIANTMDLWGLSRKKACLIYGILLVLLAVPCWLGFNVLSGFPPLGAGSTILAHEDTVVSNIIHPLGSLEYNLFCVTKKGWGWDNFVNEANTGKGLKIKKFMKGYMTYVLPVLVMFVFIMGLVGLIKG